MKLVPLKPTLDMALAAENASMACNRLAESNQLPPDAYEWPTQRIWHCVRVYEAMIAAAPAAPNCAVTGRQDVALDPMAGTLSQGVQPAVPVSLKEDVIDDLWGKRASIIQFARAVEQAAHAVAHAAFADQAHAWHIQIRTALGLDAHAPWRFDQYAHLIEQSITADATRNSAREAWEAVVALLDELRPGWEVGDAPPRQLALDIIRSALGGPDLSSKTGCLSPSADAERQAALVAQPAASAEPSDEEIAAILGDVLGKDVRPTAVTVDFARALLSRYGRPAGDAQPVIELRSKHPDDLAVDSFACAMKDKLALARAKGRSGWQGCDPADLSRMLREHVEKGDPRDVANFCMFLWNKDQPIAAPVDAQKADDARDAERWREFTRQFSMTAETLGPRLDAAIAQQRKGE